MGRTSSYSDDFNRHHKVKPGKVYPLEDNSSNMKLYRIAIDNQKEYGDHDSDIDLIVCNSQAEAEIRAESWLLRKYDETGWSEAEVVEEVDGFKVTVHRQ